MFCLHLFFKASGLFKALKIVTEIHGYLINAGSYFSKPP